jgi:pyruvate formate lyase activating enzyme
MRSGLKYVYEGNVPGEGGENTYCPKCGETLVKRFGVSLVENKLKDGSCPSCGLLLEGVWK